MTFRVSLDRYFGPPDLLLHLVRQHELAAESLPLAEVAEQFVRHVEALKHLDVDSIGDFLDVASTLLEIKSRGVLPAPVNEHDGPPLDDPQRDLVERLLEYRQYRDAAEQLERLRDRWRERHARTSPDSAGGPPRGGQPPIASVELWDLVSAFGRVMQEKLRPPPAAEIRYDETPIRVYVQRIYARLERDGPVAFADLFPESVHKSQLVGVFLALLELVRHGHALVEQRQRFGELTVQLGGRPLDAQADAAEVGQQASGEAPAA